MSYCKGLTKQYKKIINHVHKHGWKVKKYDAGVQDFLGMKNETTIGLLKRNKIKKAYSVGHL